MKENNLLCIQSHTCMLVSTYICHPMKTLYFLKIPCVNFHRKTKVDTMHMLAFIHAVLQKLETSTGAIVTGGSGSVWTPLPTLPLDPCYLPNKIQFTIKIILIERWKAIYIICSFAKECGTGKSSFRRLRRIPTAFAASFININKKN
jgi:hypothetical protein